MASYTGSKINQLLKVWSAGTVAVTPWLEKHGIYQQLVHEYEKTSWLRQVGQGAYAKAGDKVEWTGGLYAIQEQLKLPIHVGGKTALQMQGYAHFLPMGKDAVVSLFGLPDIKLPVWFKQLSLGRQGSLHYDESLCRRSRSRTNQERHGAVSDQSIRT